MRSLLRWLTGSPRHPLELPCGCRWDVSPADHSVSVVLHRCPAHHLAPVLAEFLRRLDSRRLAPEDAETLAHLLSELDGPEVPDLP